ncbi:MAG: hypothetical protein D8G53_06115 [Candidatus Saccharimonas sp.]|jgi:hypothetical protein|nr:MAG: hypothetical protein D8G53_06115 [Candidatus Saccharimonas sp.]
MKDIFLDTITHLASNNDVLGLTKMRKIFEGLIANDICFDDVSLIELTELIDEIISVTNANKLPVKIDTLPIYKLIKDN